MSFRNRLGELRPKTTTRVRSDSRHQRRISLEALEPRINLSTITWNGAGDGTSFTQAANWIGNKAPGATDDALINVGSAVTISLPTVSYSVNSVTQSGGTLLSTTGTSFTTTTGLTLSNGTFNDNAGSFINPVSIINSTLNLTANSGMASFAMGGNDTLNGPIASNQTVRSEGGLGGNLDSNLTLASGATNSGNILLQSATGSGYQSRLTVPGGTTFTNTGTILVNPSNNPSTITGNFINRGTITVTGGASLVVGATGQTFTQQSGTLSAAGTFTCNAGTLLIAGGTLSGQVQAQGCSLQIASTVTNASTVYVIGSSNPTTLISNDSAKATVWVQAINYSDATLMLASGAANLGTIQLQPASNTGYASHLAVASGTIFTNTGTILVNPSTSASSINGNFINQGTITVTGGASLVVGAAGQTFTQQSGSIAAAGAFTCNAGTLLIAGGTLSGQVQAQGCSLQIASTVTNASTVYVIGSSNPTTLISNDSAKATVWVQAINYSDATLMLASGAANLGTIQLQPASNTGYASHLAVASGTIFTNTGTILVNPSTSASSINGNFINQGTITVTGGASLVVGAAGQTFTQQSGSIAAAGAFTCNAGTLLIAGGTLSGQVQAQGCSLQIASTVTNASTVYVIGSSNPTTLISNDSAKATVWVQAINYSDATLMLASGAANLGTIQLQPASNTGYASHLAVASGTTFTNIGTILVNPSTSASSINGNFINQGTITVTGGASLVVGAAGQTFTQQSGSITATGAFTCNAGLLLVQGGTVTGQFQAQTCSIQIASSLTAPVTVFAIGSSTPTTLVSNDSALGTIRVQAINYSDATLMLASGAANLGTIQLQPASNTGYASHLAVASGTIFTNTGTILVNPSTAASSINGNFVNQGTITIASASLIVTGTSFLNQASGLINASGTLDVSGSTFTNNGTLQVGPGPALLTLKGIYNQSASGTLAIGLGGKTAGTLFDQLNVTGAANLNGTLAVSLIGTYAPSLNDAFKVLTFASSTGTFATYTGTLLPNNLTLQPSQTSTALTLVTIPQPQADLAVSVSTSAGPVPFGSNITYVVTVTNNGPNAATGVSLTNTLPIGVPVVSATPSIGTVSTSGNVETVNFGGLALGASATLTVVLAPTASGGFLDSAAVSGTLTDPNLGNNSASSTATVSLPASSDLSVSVTASPVTVSLGSHVVYTVTVLNNGPDPASGIILSDILPAGVPVYMIRPSQGVYSVSNGVITANLGSLFAQTTATLTIELAPIALGSIVDQASVSATTADPNLANNAGSATSTVVPLLAPGVPVLTTASDSGRSQLDRITNVTQPVFSVATTDPATSTVQLLRSSSLAGPYSVVAIATAGFSTVQLTDSVLYQASLSGSVDGTYYYESRLIEGAGNLSPASASVAITVLTVKPAAPNLPSLEAASDSGPSQTDQITNVTHPVFDITGVAPGGQVELFRSIKGSTPILVGVATGLGNASVSDGVGAQTDGTYLYQTVVIDIAGNVGPASLGLPVTIVTQAPPSPTIQLYGPDNTGASNGHPGTTGSRTPRFSGTGAPGDRIVIINLGTGISLGSTVVGSNGSYLVQVSSPLADGIYLLEVQIIDLAGNLTISPSVTITVQGTPPSIVPTLGINPLDDTGVSGDGITTNRQPRFVGKTDPGDLVTLYVLNNGVLSSPQLVTTASAVNGSFSFQFPGALSNSSFSLVARSTNAAGVSGTISPALNVRIISVAGDYYDVGSAQFTVFRPTTETYIVRGAGALQVDTTPGRDVPLQYDFNGDGKIDLAAYRYDAAQYYGFVSNNTTETQQFGQGSNSLPVSGAYDSTGHFDFALFNPNTSTWAISLPRPGGEVLTFGVAGTDIPVPGAYNGGGITEVATFRGKTVFGNDADSFNVVASDFINNYQVSFTDPAVIAKGFVYKAGDIPAPADFDGVGRDEFAIYRPSTGQFFVLNTPNLFDKTAWTLRTITVTIPGGPKAGDQPVSEDYEGTGKASPTVFRPSTSTFYEIPTTTGVEQTIQFGQPSVDVAAAGPLQYRLSALFGLSSPGGGNGALAISPTPGGPRVQAASIPGPTNLSIPMASITTTPMTSAPKITPVGPSAAVLSKLNGSPGLRYAVATPSGPRVPNLSILVQKPEAGTNP